MADTAIVEAVVPAVAVVASSTPTIVGAAVASLTPNAFVISIAGQQINLLSVLIVGIVLGLLFTFYRIQSSKKLDFTDIITFDGRKVSLTKIMQLIGGLSATWIVLKMGAVGTLTSELFGLYLLFIGAIEGYAKYVSAKYGYSETSVKDGCRTKSVSDQDKSAQDILAAAEGSATDAEMSARDAKVSVKNASADLKTSDK